MVISGLDTLDSENMVFTDSCQRIILNFMNYFVGKMYGGIELYEASFHQ